MYVNLISYTYNTENLFEDGNSFRDIMSLDHACSYEKKVVIIHFFAYMPQNPLGTFFITYM